MNRDRFVDAIVASGVKFHDIDGNVNIDDLLVSEYGPVVYFAQVGGYMHIMHSNGADILVTKALEDAGFTVGSFNGVLAVSIMEKGELV